MMKIALNGATTMHADLSTDILAAAAAGYDYLEIWYAKLYRYLESKTTADLATEFESAGIKPYAINSIENITFGPIPAYAQVQAECRKLAEISQQIGCPYIVVPGKMPPNATRDEIVAESSGVLIDLASIADEYGVSLAFEFLGQADCSVQTLDLAGEVVNAVARENVGLVIDTFHFYAGGSSFEAIDRVDPEKVFIFHVNDADDLPKMQLTDAQRLYPGLGVLPLAEIRDRLFATGYDRVVSIEIFHPEYWEQDPFVVAAEAKRAAEAVFGLSRQEGSENGR
jgi:2-keto-myo-inositol isomerase